MEILNGGVLPTLKQLKTILENIQDADYCRNLESLDGSTLGRHARHVLNMFDCLLKGFSSGIISYDTRDRSPDMETKTEFAISKTEDFLKIFPEENKDLVLEFSNESGHYSLSSTYFRELQYCYEHAVHHMAIMKNGLTEIGYSGDLSTVGKVHSTMVFTSGSHLN